MQPRRKAPNEINYIKKNKISSACKNFVKNN